VRIPEDREEEARLFLEEAGEERVVVEVPETGEQLPP